MEPCLLNWAPSAAFTARGETGLIYVPPGWGGRPVKLKSNYSLKRTLASSSVNMTGSPESRSASGSWVPFAPIEWAQSPLCPFPDLLI